MIGQPCPHCGETDGHLTKCKFWMLTPEQLEILYGYPVCRCHGLPESEERRVLHLRETLSKVREDLMP